MLHRLSAEPSAVDSFFPLRLTPFEHYMHLDHAAGNSMVYCVRLEVAGIIDREALTAAVAAAASRHPLVRARVRERSWGRPVWTVEPDARVPLHFVDEPSHRYRAPRIDLTREPGARVEVVQRLDTALLQVFMHHAVADGIGTLQWIGDILAHYALSCGADPATVKCSQLDDGRLTSRRWPRAGTGSGPDPVPSRIRTLWNFLAQAPQPLFPRRTMPAPAEERHEDFLAHRFSAEQTRHLGAVARKNGASLNDLILRDLFVTLVKWNDRLPRGLKQGDAWYRLTMPTNLREYEDRGTSAANIVGVTFLNRRKSAIAGGPDSLLQSILHETREIRTIRRGGRFLGSLAFLDSVPGVLKLFVRVPRCMATAVFTNLGDPSRRFTTRFRKDSAGMIVGNLRVLSFQGVPPLRSGTNLSLTANSFGRRLMLNLKASPEWFDGNDANELLAMLVAELSSH